MLYRDWRSYFPRSGLRHYVHLISRYAREGVTLFDHNKRLSRYRSRSGQGVDFPEPASTTPSRREGSIFRTLASYAALYYDGPTSVSVIGSRVLLEIHLDPVLLKK